jgi:hypothetical protein
MRVLPLGRRSVIGIRLAIVLSIAPLVGVSPLVASAAEARPAADLQLVSQDPFRQPGYEHRSEVEPDVVTHGRTVVATYQVGRAAEGGSVAIGVATSTDDARSWSDHIVGGSSAATGGRYERASDPSVTWGAQGTGWLVGFLGLTLTGPFQIPSHSAVLVASSQNGTSFGRPAVVARAPRGVVFDKPWVACDDHPSSHYYGRCYAVWDELGLRRGPYAVVLASVSRDGGRHWSPPVRTDGPAKGFGVIPLVRSDGTVTVVYRDTRHPLRPAIASFASSNGGRSWGDSSTISTIRRAPRELPVRDPGFPSAAIGPRGSFYVAWSDCRFERSCAVDDIVVSTSSDGKTWTPPDVAARADPATATSLVTPGLAADARRAGSRAAIVFYAVGGQRCSKFAPPSACSVSVGYVSSRQGRWGAPAPLGWRMRPNWFPCTPAGCMWGDYIAAAFLRDGRLVTALPLAKRPARTLDVAMYAPRGGLRIRP